eukprot:6848819-Prorocentrum_lima.AAC.1
MTSSLVGSEMCIRDRDMASQKACAYENDLKRNMDLEMHACRIAAENKICLLYTSDAADDM